MLDFDTILRWVQDAALWLWSQWQVKVLLLHILSNVVVAVAATIRTQEFVLGLVPEFLYRKILPYVLVYGVFALAGASIGMDEMATAVWALLELTLLNDTLDNLKKLGIERVPAALTKERLD